MAYKVTDFEVSVRNGGFIVRVSLENNNVDANPLDNKIDEYIVPTYGRLLRAFKEEFKDYKPARKTRAKKEPA